MVKAVEDGFEVEEVIKHNGSEVEGVDVTDLGEEGDNTVQIYNDDPLVWSENSFMGMARKMFDSVEVAFADKDVDTVQVYVQDEFTDQQGKESESNVFHYNYSRADFEELELKNFKDMLYGEEWRVFQQADSYSIHPAIYNELKDKYKQELHQ